PPRARRKGADGLRSAASADEVIDSVEPSDAYDDQVDRDNVVQQSRHEEDQDAGDEGNKRCDMGNCNGHGDLLGWQSMIMTALAAGYTCECYSTRCDHPRKRMMQDFA